MKRGLGVLGTNTFDDMPSASIAEGQGLDKHTVTQVQRELLLRDHLAKTLKHGWPAHDRLGSIHAKRAFT